jgi:hypothetical protein
MKHNHWINGDRWHGCPACNAEYPPTRRHEVPGCERCDRATSTMHPSHDASPRCESGGREHCSCSACF